MDWFKINALEPSKTTRRIFDSILNEIKNGNAIAKFYFDIVLKQIPDNIITKRISRTRDYIERLEAMIRLEKIHTIKREFENLYEYVDLRIRELNSEIRNIEQTYIKPTYVNYIAVSYPKRSYLVNGKPYTTYKGTPIYHKRIFVGIAMLLLAKLLF